MPTKRKLATGKKTNATTIAARVKAAKAMELRMEGKTFSQIARELNYNCVQSAHEAVKRALHSTLQEPADALRTLELERIDAMWGIHYLNAQGGDVQALAACMKLMERRAKLIGLDAPVKSELAGPDGQPLAVAPTVLNVIIDGERQDTPTAPPAG